MNFQLMILMIKGFVICNLNASKGQMIPGMMKWRNSNTNENNINNDCVSKNKQDVTQIDISGYVTQHQVSDCNYDNDLNG